MRGLFLTIGAALAVGSAAMAAPPGPNDTATVCLDPGGNSFPAICHTQNATRFSNQPDICHCDGALRQVDAPWCAPGEKPAPDTAALARARVDFAAHNRNSLVGFTFEGKRNCVPLNGLNNQ
jgi:hypothetical protein